MLSLLRDLAFEIRSNRDRAAFKVDGDRDTPGGVIQDLKIEKKKMVKFRSHQIQTTRL